MDWRSSCALHGWNAGLSSIISAEERFSIFMQAGGITWEYLFSRRSDFAGAVCPAVKHAIDTEVLGDEHLTLLEGKEPPTMDPA